MGRFIPVGRTILKSGWRRTMPGRERSTRGGADRYGLFMSRAAKLALIESGRPLEKWDEEAISAVGREASRA